MWKCSLTHNPIDYAIWRIMQERVYNKGKIANIEELRQRIVDECERLDQCIIDGAVNEWRKRLWGCERVLLLKEDSLTMNCDSWCNSVGETVHYDYRLIVWLLITFAVTVFSVLWLFQSHAAVVKHYIAFCVKHTANSDTDDTVISKSTFPVCVSEHFHI